MTILALKRVGIDEAFVQQREAAQEVEFQRAFTLELALVGRLRGAALRARAAARRSSTATTGCWR